MSHRRSRGAMATRTSFNVIYKGWLKKGTKDDNKKKGFLRSSTRWKKKYCALCSMSENGTDIAYLCIYEKEAATITEVSKEFLKLWPHYRVFKKHDPSGKNHVFEVKAPEETFRLMAESVTMMDLWVFYIQIQTKMHRNFVGESFEVTPVESDSVRRIGARGSKCLIHLSKWGLTLALKRTKVVVAQWPLKCIREFESSETGMFSFDAGRNSPMGQAHYSFSTNPGEDGTMYDTLDAYTTQVMQARAGGPAGAPDYQEVTEEEVTKDYESLRLATFGLLPVKSRNRDAQLPSLPTPSPRSMAVPVPVASRPEEYNRLKRHPSEIGQKLPVVEDVKPPKSPLRRNNSQPQLSPRPPPVPLATHPVLGSKLHRSSSSEGLATGIQDIQEYTDMSPGNTLERKKGPSAKKGVPVKVPPRMPFAKGPPKAATPSHSLLSKSPYYNTLLGSYENCPIISPSPRNAFAFTNEGFVSSPGSLPISPPRTNQPGAAHLSALYSPQPVTHTYYEQSLSPKGNPPVPHALMLGSLQNPSAQLDSAVLYAKVNKNFRKSLSADNLLDLQQIMERRMSVASQISVPQRMSGVSIGSFSDRMSVASNRMSGVSVSLEGSSPLIGSLDLAGLPRTTPSWMGLRDLPSVPNSSASPQDTNLYYKMPALSVGASNVVGAASVSSQASSTGKHYEDIDKMRKLYYEDMSRRRSALIQSDREDIQNAVIVRSESTSSNPRDIPPPLPPDRGVGVVTKLPQVSPGSYENTDPVPLRKGAKGSLRRAQSTGDLLDTYGDDSDSISLGSPPNVGQLTFMKRFKSIPNLREGIVELQKSLSGSRSNSSNSLNAKTENSSKGSPVTMTLRKLKQHSAAKKKQRAKEEQAVAAEQPQARAPSSPEEPKVIGQQKQPKERVFKAKHKDHKGKSKDKGKVFSPKDVKIVASGKTRTFTRQAAFSSSTSLDTISINSHMSGRELPARPSLDLPNVREGVYEDIDDDDDDIANQRRFSESLHTRQERSRAHGERRNTAPSVHPSNQSTVSFQAKI